MALRLSISTITRNTQLRSYFHILQNYETTFAQQRRNESISADSIQTRSPYEELKVEIDVKSSKDNPMKVNAYGDERTIACVCDDMHFMTLKKGPPTQCKCGHWFQLVDAHKFWIKDDSS